MKKITITEKFNATTFILASSFTVKKTPYFTNSSDLYRKIDASVLTAAEKSQARVAVGLTDKVAGAVAYLINLLTMRQHRHV